MGLVAGAVGRVDAFEPGDCEAQQNDNLAQTLRAANASGRPIFIKDGVVLSMDRQVGDFGKADVLIRGKEISAVDPNVAASAPKDAVVVNAARMIVMPGFVDTHHQQYEAVMRNILADGAGPGRITQEKLWDRNGGQTHSCLSAGGCQDW